MPDKIIVYSGSFDPATYGHLDLINRTLDKFLDYELFIAVSNNYSKNSLFSLDERVEMLNKIYNLNSSRVKVMGFTGLLVDFMKKVKANIILRGLRAVSDFEYELKLAHTNRNIGENIETIFMMPKEEYSYISSSMVRELAFLGGDVRKFVHPVVESYLSNKYKKIKFSRDDDFLCK